ncbi:Rho guanine nucleotide exchange factor 28 [Paragonimus heterotremus]|uniref:Rho guanine nucleotide exchange factor 28 n=1 Tax=Paragonimus heterotremus TaxID=100268 RepID=A0A8J4WUM4_9TREM|nr:Rho guanine nucleotide exchange factor 28 [Paragonimus heterotremus]
MDMLLMVCDVYMVPFPDFDPSQFDTGPDGGITNAQLREALFPGLDQLIRAHERLLRPLLALHDKAEDHVVKSLGSCLVRLFDRDTQLALSKLYGGFMFAQKRIRERLQICKRWPPVAQFFEKCKQDPRSARRSLEDCHMVIVQRWTKVETLLDAIIKSTLNHPVEVENLETARSTVRSLLKGAEAVMTAREHVDKLSDFADNLLVPVSSTEDTEEHRLRREMKSPNTSLINYGPLRIVPYAIGQQAPAAVEVIGVALNSCFFVLQRHPESGNYQLFKGTKMPPILWWGQAYGYFRKSVEKGSFGFFILLHSESVLTLFRCNTADELSRWERIMNHGFAQWRETAPVTMESLDLDLSQTLSAAAERWERTNAVLNLLYDLDADLERAWAARSCVCLASIEDRLNQLKTRQDAAEDNNVESDYFSTTPPGLTGNFGPRPKSAGYINRTPKTASTPTTTTDLLSKYTFLTELDSKSDLDQVFALFQENLDRLRFTIMGAPPSGLSRSASDVEERKRPPNKAIRKIETFSVRDSTHRKCPLLTNTIGQC